MLVDINQQYVDLGLFPQWDDIARELNVDSMKTEWVRVCVRPEQSFTRAILEIYMQDGGTLGEVIAALRKQKQYRVIQEISDLAEEFLDVYNTYHKENLRSSEVGGPAGPHLYSILRTLCETFQKAGQEDPLGKFQLYSGGFKQYMRSREVIVNSGFNMHYQGKEGNGNRFLTRQTCESLCQPSQDSCMLPKITGPCSDRVEQFWYDKEKDECFSFFWGMYVFTSCLIQFNSLRTGHQIRY